jgi:pyruvate/2-oxoglutarate dehydrogenase complex dihydrolipoamide dehydrogenase (E3) component
MTHDTPPRGVNLHPSNHTPSALKQDTFDVIVIGSGQAGRNLAARTAEGGLSTLIVEEELFGGDCPFWACIPSKAMLRPNETLEVGRGMNGSKQLIDTGKTVDVDAVFTRRDGFVQMWDDTFIVDLSLSQKCSIVRGSATLTDVKRVEVKNVNGERITITANNAVVLSTGSDALIPTIPGLADIHYWTPRHATSTNTVPEDLLILGGGAVGTEMATVFLSLGSKVTILGSNESLLPKFEPEAGRRVAAALTAKGAKVVIGASVTSFEKTASGFIAKLSTGETIPGQIVLISTGRKPRSYGIGLEAVGLDPNALKVDDSLSVTGTKDHWLYAIGDVNGRNPVTHMAVYQARAAALTILARAQNIPNVEPKPWSKYAATADHETFPQVVFTDPNVASVGLTVQDAKNKGLNIKEAVAPGGFQFPGAWVHAEHNYDGWAQWVIDTDRNVLVGATIIGREAVDLLHASTVAIVGEIPVEKLWHAVPSFPTMSEIYVALLKASGY